MFLEAYNYYIYWTYSYKFANNAKLWFDEFLKMRLTSRRGGVLPDLTSALMGGFPNLTSADKGGRGGPKSQKMCWHNMWTAPYRKSLFSRYRLSKGYVPEIVIRFLFMSQISQGLCNTAFDVSKVWQINDRLILSNTIYYQGCQKDG